MLTRKAVEETIQSFIAELRKNGYNPSRVILFGSYVKGSPNELSDIDVAVWDKRFTGLTALDIEPIASLISKFRGLQLHTYNENETKESDPFIDVIERTGVVLDN